jgi:hypothetical protein
MGMAHRRTGNVPAHRVQRADAGVLGAYRFWKAHMSDDAIFSSPFVKRAQQFRTGVKRKSNSYGKNSNPLFARVHKTHKEGEEIVCKCGARWKVKEHHP